MNFLLPVFAAISSLPSWWWTNGPGLGDPSPEDRNNQLVTAGLTLAVGLGAAALIGKDPLTKSVVAFAGGRIGAGIAKSLNPQPLPPVQ